MELSIFVAQFISGLTYGMVLYAITLGLVLVFSIMDIVNIAHGSLYMLGAFIGYSIWQALLPVIPGAFWVSIILAALVIGACGVGLERLLRPLYIRGHLDQILFTFGFIFIIQDIVKFFWRGQCLSVSLPAGLTGNVEIAGGVVPAYNLFLIGITLFIAGCVWLYLTRTTMGKIIRAAVYNREMVSLLGIPLPRLYLVAFAMATFVVGMIGLLAAPRGMITPTMDMAINTPAFCVCVMAGMGAGIYSIWGALLASLIIGEVFSFGIMFAPEWAMVSMFAVVAIVLIVRPQGLLKGRTG